MIPLFINLTILVSLIAVVGMAVYSYQRSAETVSLAQRNAARMEQVAYSIRSGLRPAVMGGPILVPLGDPDGPPVAVVTRDDGKTAVDPAEQVCVDGMAAYAAGTPSRTFNQTCRHMTVPRWLVADDRTPWGGRYAFCPYSPTRYDDPAPVPAALGSDTGLVRDGGSSYRIRTAQVRGRAYVLRSDPGAVGNPEGTVPPPTTATEDVVGFLLSPPPHVRDQLPRCRDVAKVNGAWLVIPSEGGHPGSVVPVLSRGIGTGQVANQGEVILHAAEAARGTGLPGDVPGTGDDADHPMALRDALDLWHLTPWRSTTIRIQPGTYAFGPSDTVPGVEAVPRLALTTALPGRSLRLESSGAGARIVSSGGNVDLAIGVDAVLDGVSLGSGVQLRPMEGGTVRVVNGQLSHVRVDGGDLSLGNGVRVTADLAANPYSAIDVVTGRLRLSVQDPSGAPGTIPIDGAPPFGIQLFGGELVMNGTGISALLATGGTTVTPSSSARVKVSPAPNGAMPSVTARDSGGGSAGGVLGGEMTAAAALLASGRNTGASSCDGGTGTCLATCQTGTERASGIQPLRIAVGGSCASTDAGSAEGRPSLMTNANAGDLGGSPSTWTCTWRPGDVFTMSPIAGGGVWNGTAPFPGELSASAHCLPNPSVTLPVPPTSGNPANG